MAIYSNSKLGMYEACPLKYKLRHIDKIQVPEEEGIEAFLGIRVHEALEKLYNDLSYSKLLTLKELLSYYNAEWDKNWNDSVVIRKKDYSSQNYKDTGIRCLKAYYEKYKPFNKATTMGSEVKLNFSLTKDERYKMTGYIDRLDKIKDGQYEIHDYKTSNSLPLQEHLDNDRQLALYDMGIRESFPDIKEVKLVWHYLTFDTEMSSKRTPEQIEDLRKKMIALIDTIEADTEFKHRESALYGWCEYPEYCPARKHLVKVQSLPSNQVLLDDGVKLVSKYIAAWETSKRINEEIGRLKDALIGYAKKNGIEQIAGNGYAVRVKIGEKLKFPDTSDPQRSELEKLVKAAGLWEQFSKLDTGELLRFMESDNENKALIEKIKQFTNKEESITVNRPKVLKKEGGGENVKSR